MAQILMDQVRNHPILNTECRGLNSDLSVRVPFVGII